MSAHHLKSNLDKKELLFLPGKACLLQDLFITVDNASVVLPERDPGQHPDNALDFMEYTAALHLILRGNLEDRLKWSFKIYDKDGNGKLDRQEVKNLIRIIYKIQLHTTAINMTPNEVCDRIFELVDENHDGQISFSEFMEGAQKDEWVMNMLKLDVNASGWVMQNCVKMT
eukprot:XP_013983227.1 PREDICTED: guanylyl cyclase-activating protein 2-like [Salmo salar]